MSTLTQLFSDIANAIRQKDGTVATIVPTAFAERILAIQSGSGSSSFSNVLTEIIAVDMPTAADNAPTDTLVLTVLTETVGIVLK